MHHAIKRALTRPAGAGGEIIHFDSLYAINMTTSRWLPKTVRNREMVRRLRRQWRLLHRCRPGEVHLRHVPSHTRVPGNDAADWLADIGSQDGGPVPLARARAFLERACEATSTTGTEGGSRSERGGCGSSAGPGSLSDAVGVG